MLHMKSRCKAAFKQAVALACMYKSEASIHSDSKTVNLLAI